MKGVKSSPTMPKNIFHFYTNTFYFLQKENDGILNTNTISKSPLLGSSIDPSDVPFYDIYHDEL
jgi:hypothetical protein